MPKPFLFSVLGFLIFSASSFACCTAWRHGGRPVRIAAQEVLLIWDAERGVEHFVRRANFQSETTPEDFGFLVPTPTQPKLSEVPDLVFDELGELIKPKIETRKETKVSFMPLVLAPMFTLAEESTKDMAPRSAGVEVLDTAVVGGFEVAVLRASGTTDLINWLKQNDYDARPEIHEWVAPYVAKKWIITAFKYAGNVDRSPASLTRASICLSFETETPFFPYRVPRDIRVEPQEGALLRLYFAGQERVLGDFEGADGQEWSATTKYSDRSEIVPDILGRVMESFDGEAELPDASWLTTFEDETWPGGAADLYFKPSPNKDAITPAPIIRAQIRVIPLPLDLIFLCLVIGIYFYRRNAKARRRRA